jgi:hypothetical protein
MSISVSIIIGIFTPRELLDPCHLRVIGDLDTHEQTVDCGQRITEKNIGGLGRRGGGLGCSRSDEVGDHVQRPSQPSIGEV